MPPSTSKTANLTLLLGEKLLLHVFSHLTYDELFYTRMVCSRWKRICERNELYASLSMQDFISHNRHLPMHVLLAFLSALSLSEDEVAALKECCHAIPIIDVDNENEYRDFDTSTASSSSSISPSWSEESLPGSLNSSSNSISPPSSIISKISLTPKAREDKEGARKEKIKKEKEKKHLDIKKQWVEDILPNWEKKKSSKKVKELIWHGIPPSVRGTLWPFLIGNDLRITPELFEIFGARAARAKQQGEGALGREGTVTLIQLDLPRTFPALSIFQQGGPCHGQLANVLESWTCYRPDVGYVQGMSYLAAVFLLNLDEYHAFICLANLLNNPVYMSFFTMNLTEIRKYMDAMDTVMAKELPKVHRSLKRMGITNEIFMIDWVLTLYSKSLPLDVATRVWDVVFLEGEAFVFIAALGILRMYGNLLENAGFDDCMTLLTHLPQDVDDDELFAHISAIKAKVPCEQFRKIFESSNAPSHPRPG